jgi:hypothetical protein
MNADASVASPGTSCSMPPYCLGCASIGAITVALLDVETLSGKAPTSPPFEEIAARDS